MAKTIMEKDKIELGPSKFLVSWDWIKSFVPQMVDFRPLQRVWEEYDNINLISKLLTASLILFVALLV